jgi:hypothetical protein
MNQCSDIVSAEDCKKLDKSESIFSYDQILQDDTGDMYKAVYDAQGNPIDLDDILHLSREDFMDKYKFRSAVELLDKYMSAFNILTSEETLQLLSQQINETIAEYDRWGELDSADLI